MFKFLFRRNSQNEIEASTESQRETLLRALGEVNEITSSLTPKPAVTINPATGMISLALPEYMPDEALALPSPGESPVEPTEDANALN